MSSSDKRNRSAGGGGSDYSGDWEYKTNEMDSYNYFDKAASNSNSIGDSHGLTIRDITDRHVENFMDAIEHELVKNLMTTFTEKSAEIINENRKEMMELQRDHERDQNNFEDELLKLNDEMKKNAAELEDFIAND